MRVGNAEERLRVKVSPMLRHVVLAWLLLASAPLPGMAEAPTARVAFLSALPSSDPLSEKTWQTFADALNAFGWTEGKNVMFIRRYSEGREDRANALAAELIAEKPDVIVAVTYQNAQAAKQSTKTIPIVFVNVPNPIGLGFIASFARPGGNITGISGQAEDLVGKSMQLLKETRPGITRMAYLGYGEASYWKETERVTAAAAQQLGLAMVMVPVTSAADLEPGFTRIEQERVDALVVSALPIFRQNLEKIAGFAIDHRLPTISFSEPMAQGGLLLALSPDTVGAFQRAAAIVDKILRGARPADIPVEQPTRFHLLVNLKTAGAIGVELPPGVVARADEVID